MIIMVTAINPGGQGGKEGKGFTTRGIMEHEVITNLRMVNGDQSLPRQRRQTFIIALGQVEDSYEEIIQHLVKETDFGNDLDRVVENLRNIYGDGFTKVSGGVWNFVHGQDRE